MHNSCSKNKIHLHNVVCFDFGCIHFIGCITLKKPSEVTLNKRCPRLTLNNHKGMQKHCTCRICKHSSH